MCLATPLSHLAALHTTRTLPAGTLRTHRLRAPAAPGRTPHSPSQPGKPGDLCQRTDPPRGTLQDGTDPGHTLLPRGGCRGAEDHYVKAGHTSTPSGRKEPPLEPLLALRVPPGRRRPLLFSHFPYPSPGLEALGRPARPHRVRALNRFQGSSYRTTCAVTRVADVLTQRGYPRV